MSRHRAQQEGQLWTALRAIQAICGFATLLSLFTAYKDITLSGVADDDTYRPAQLRHFFLAMAAYTSFGYGVLYLICVTLSGRLSPDVLLERLMDGALAGVYLIVGILLAPKMNCGLGMYCTCTSVQAMIVFAFFNCALSVIAVGMSLVLKTMPAHPDSIENLVPRGHYGRAPSPAEGDAPRPRHKKKPHASPRVDDDNTDNIAPRGKFGSVRGSNLADLMKLQRQDEPAPAPVATTENRVNYFV